MAIYGTILREDSSNRRVSIWNVFPHPLWAVGRGLSFSSGFVRSDSPFRPSDGSSAHPWRSLALLSSATSELGERSREGQRSLRGIFRDLAAETTGGTRHDSIPPVPMVKNESTDLGLRARWGSRLPSIRGKMVIGDRRQPARRSPDVYSLPFERRIDFYFPPLFAASNASKSVSFFRLVEIERARRNMDSGGSGHRYRKIFNLTLRSYLGKRVPCFYGKKEKKEKEEKCFYESKLISTTLIIWTF